MACAPMQPSAIEENDQDDEPQVEARESTQELATASIPEERLHT